MAPTIRKTLLAVLLASAVSSLAVAADTPPVAGQAKTETSAAKDPRAPYSAALFPLIAKTQAALTEAMTPVESALADELVDKSKKFLADKQVYQRLVEMAYERAQADGVTDDPDKYAKQSLAALTASIRLTPGLMGRDALVNRAKLMSQVAKFYSKHDPSMCRYIPADFSILMSVDAPWVAEVDDTVFTQALDDEIDAAKRMMGGSLPIGVNDSDAQLVFSKFAGEWLGGLDAETRYQIGSAKTNGNYCQLWKFMFLDFSKMAETFPSASDKVLRPIFTMMSRGWLDAGLWSYEVKAKKTMQADSEEGDESSGGN